MPARRTAAMFARCSDADAARWLRELEADEVAALVDVGASAAEVDAWFSGLAPAPIVRAPAGTPRAAATFGDRAGMRDAFADVRRMFARGPPETPPSRKRARPADRTP